MIHKVYSLQFTVYRIFLILFTVHCSLFTVAYAQVISSTELINNAKQYDGQVVTYSGEVIGDVMKRGNFAWLNVNDGANAIGIWIEASLTKDILYTGSFKSKGDLIEITGIFNRACPGHGGDLDIHAREIKKIQVGNKLYEKLDINKRNFAIALFIILGLIWILTRLKTR
ncbi:MAG: DNA-binding protein [Candidatus Omnitrophota bacterium]